MTIQWSHILPPTNRVWCAECERKLEGDEVGLCKDCLEQKRLFWEYHATRLEEEPTGVIERPNRTA